MCSTNVPRNAESGLYVGLMSGTSLDGVDAVLVDFGNHPPQLLSTHYQPYQSCLTNELLSLQRPGERELQRAALIANQLAHLYHQSVERVLGKAGVGVASVHAIGCHGQTIRHNPKEGYSVQLGNPALLAELSDIRVVADFRSRDIAASGQGAPLVPAFHEAMFRSPDVHRVILNIGGIANITDLNPKSITMGFDTGPGNILLDAWIRQNTGKPYDADGNWGRSGNPIRGLLDSLLAHPFLAEAPPKSCGREQFNIDWLQTHLARGGAASKDIQATLLQLTATSVTTAIRRWCGIPDELIVCGGGVHNSALLQQLSEQLPATRLLSSSTLGVGPDWVEAMAFAWLARQTCLGLPGNLPAVTGAHKSRVLGAIYPAN